MECAPVLLLDARPATPDRKEHGWFSVAGSLPGVAMRAEEAAAQILRACRDGKSEVVLRSPVNLAVALQTFLPGTVRAIHGPRRSPGGADALLMRTPRTVVQLMCCCLRL